MRLLPVVLAACIGLEGDPRTARPGERDADADAASAEEVRSLTATGAWEEVCLPLLAQPGLCGGGTTPDGPFHLHPGAGPDRAALYRCYSGADHFLSPDPACEGRTVEGLLGYVSTVRTSEMPRALLRCYGDAHLHALDADCPAGSRAEAVLGYVR